MLFRSNDTATTEIYTPLYTLSLHDALPIFAGASAAALPFYPSGWPLGLAAIAATLTLFRDRAGLTFALAVPVLPLGNSSAGLAWAYAALALAWLAWSWKRARTAP